MSNQEQIEEIRRRTDIVEVVGARIPLRRSGSDFSACCPFHKEKTPSFHVNPSRQFFKCFGCGEQGDVYAFLMKHDGLTFGDALRMLAERTGVQLSHGPDDGQGERRKRLLRLHAELAAFFHDTLRKSPAAQTARDYLKSRELSAEVVEAFQLGYAPAEPDALEQWARTQRFTPEEMVEGGVLSVVDRDGRQALHNRFRGRLMFPISDTQGRVVAFSGRLLDKNAKAAKYVNSAESPIFVKSHVLYALDKAQRGIVSAPGRQALICEGQIDVIRCHSAGFTTAVASQGTAFTQDHVQLLKRYADSAVLVFDSDPAGQKAAVSTARLFLAAGIAVRVARLSDGKDPDDFIRQQGAEAFRQALAQAEEVIPFQTRWLQEQERDPRAADALGRISANLIETLRECGNAVHQARMLQEAAELLNLPEAALGTQLARANEAAARRAARRATPAEETQRQNEQRFTRQARNEAEAVLVPVAAPEGEVVLDVDGAGAGAPPSPPRMRPEEYALCELLVHHLEDTALVRWVDEFVPLPLFQHPHARLVAGAAFQTARTGRDELLALQESAAVDVVDFIRRMAVAPVRSGGGGFTEKDAAHDLILGIWRQWTLGQIKTLRPEGPVSADQERQRIQLRLDLRALQTWDRGLHVIVRERARLLEHGPDIREAAPPPKAPAARPPVVAETRATSAETDRAPMDEPLEPTDELPEW